MQGTCDMVETSFLRKLAIVFAVWGPLSVTTRCGMPCSEKIALWVSLQFGWYIVPWESSAQWETLSSSPRLLSGHGHQSGIDQIQQPAMGVLVFRVVWMSPLVAHTDALDMSHTGEPICRCLYSCWSRRHNFSRAVCTFQLPGVQHGLVQYIWLHAPKYDNLFTHQQHTIFDWEFVPVRPTLSQLCLACPSSNLASHLQWIPAELIDRCLSCGLLLQLIELVRAELHKCHLYVKVDGLMSIAW